jgi:hypothetical protein
MSENLKRRRHCGETTMSQHKYSSQGNFDHAAAEMKLALSGAANNQKVYIDGPVKQLEAKQDINQ